MNIVTDPALIAQLEAAAAAQRQAGGREVTDPDLIATLDAAAAEKAKPPRSVPAEIGRQVGLTARAGIEGVTAIPQLGVDALTSIYDLGAAGVEKLTDIPQTRYSGALKVKDALTRVGFPQPENATERVVGNIVSAMTGAGGMARLGQGMQAAASPIARRVGEILSTKIGTQVAASGTGATAAGVTREEGGGVGAQLAAGALGALAPAAGSGISMAVRGALRGGDAGARRVAQNIEAFENSGAGIPTVGQATERRAMQAVESGLAKAPGSAGLMAAKAEAEAAGIGDKINTMTAALAPRAGAAPAGRQIASGIDDFTQAFKAKSGELYDKVDRYIPPDSRVQAGNTLAMLDKLTKPIAGATETSALIQTPKLAAVRDALVKDVGPGGLPYQALKELRSAIGAKLSNPSLVDDVPTGQWKQLYGALTKDMGAAARAAGPQAEQAMVRASNHYRSGLTRIEEVLSPIVAKGDPEDIFKATMAGTSEGASTLRGVMKSLPAESRKVVSATTLQRLGRATPHRQDDMGEVFSTETFLTNWNKLHPDAKSSLMGPMPDGMRRDLDQIAKVAANIREGSKVFANPSGTAQAAMTYGGAGAAIMSFLSGNALLGTSIVATPIATNVMARVMTNPKLVKFLAESTRMPVEQLPAQLNTLGQLTWGLDREDRGEMLRAVSSMRKGIREARESQQPTGPQR